MSEDLPSTKNMEITKAKREISETYIKKIPNTVMNLYSGAGELSVEKQRAHQMLLNVLLTQSKLGNDRIIAEKILSDEFVKVLLKHPGKVKNTLAASLFRSILFKKSSKFMQNAYLTDVLLESMRKHNYHGTLNEILLNKKKTWMVDKNRVLPSKAFGKNPFAYFTKMIESEELFSIENAGRMWLRKNVDEEQSSLIVELLSTKLMSNETTNSSVKTLNGIMIDWLVESNLELMNVCDATQMTMLFGKTEKEFRPFLLSLLIHQANWKTISGSLQILLNHQSVFVHDPTSVLDFVAALTKNPKLWQGREKAVIKHEQTEKTFVLNELQILALTDYILLETKNSTNTKLSRRVGDLLQLTEANKIDLKCIIKYILKKSDINDAASTRDVLQHIYINIPSLKFMDHNLDKYFNVSLLDYTTCKFDKFSHIIITLLSCLSNVKDLQHMGQEVELILRKLAASHSSLVLREIGLLATLLQGKAHMDSHVLRAEHHFLMFHKVLGILELLKPQIFEDVYCKSLYNALDSYFTLIKNHMDTKEMFGIFNRLMEFLQSYATANPSSAFKIIEANSGELKILNLFFKILIYSILQISSKSYWAEAKISRPFNSWFKSSLS